MIILHTETYIMVVCFHYLLIHIFLTEKLYHVLGKKSLFTLALLFLKIYITLIFFLKNHTLFSLKLILFNSFYDCFESHKER